MAKLLNLLEGSFCQKLIQINFSETESIKCCVVSFQKLFPILKSGENESWYEAMFGAPFLKTVLEKKSPKHPVSEYVKNSFQFASLPVSKNLRNTLSRKGNVNLRITPNENSFQE